MYQSESNIESSRLCSIATLAVRVEVVFTAVANITQLGIEGTSPAPQVVYDDRDYE
jgi:hypothetical protein